MRKGLYRSAAHYVISYNRRSFYPFWSKFTLKQPVFVILKAPTIIIHRSYAVPEPPVKRITHHKDIFGARYLAVVFYALLRQYFIIKTFSEHHGRVRLFLPPQIDVIAFPG